MRVKVYRRPNEKAWAVLQEGQESEEPVLVGSVKLECCTWRNKGDAPRAAWQNKHTVDAWVEGEMRQVGEIELKERVRYHHGLFHTESGVPVRSSAATLLDQDGRAWIGKGWL